MNSNRHITAFVIYVLISIFIFRGPLLENDPISVVINGDLQVPLTMKNFVSDYYPLWSDQYSKNNIFVTTRYPVILPILFIAEKLNLTPIVTMEIFWILTATLAGSFAYLTALFILKREYIFKKNRYDMDIIYIASLIVGFFYLFNPFFALESRHMLIRFSYAIFPLVFLAFVFAMEKNELRYIFMASLMWIFITANPRGLIIGGMILMIASVYIILNPEKKLDKNLDIYQKIKNILPTIFLIMTIFLLLSSFWLLPFFVASKDSKIEPGYIISEESLSTLNNVYIGDILRLKMPNIFGENQFFAYDPEIDIIKKLGITKDILSTLFIILIFGILLSRKSFQIRYFIYIFFIVVATIGIKSIEHIWKFYIWFVLYSPIADIFGWMFRKPIDYYPFVIFPLSILIGFAIYSYIDILGEKLGGNKRKLTICVVLIFIIIISIQSWPLLTGSFNRELDKTEIPHEYIVVNKWLEDQKNEKYDGKIIWVPRYDMAETTWFKEGHGHIRWVQDFWSSEPTYFTSMTGAKRKNNDIFFEFISARNKWKTDTLGQNRTNGLYKLLLFLNIKYIGYHDDAYFDNRYNVLSSLYSQKNITLTRKEGFIYIFENKGGLSSKFYIPSRIIITDAGYDVLTALSQFNNIDLRDIGVFFVGKKGHSQIPENFSTVLLNKNEDMFVDIDKSTILLEPFKDVKRYDPKNSWSRNRISESGGGGSWKVYTDKREIGNWDLDYEKGFIFTENESNENTIKIYFDIDSENDYELFIRLLHSQKGGIVQLSVDDKSYDIHTLDQIQVFKWEKIDTINLTKGRHILTLTNIQGLNAINLISIFNTRDYEIHMQDIYNNLTDKELVYFFEAEKDFKSKDAIISKTGGESSNGMGILLKGDSNISRDINIIREDNYKLSVKFKGRIELIIGNKNSILESDSLKFVDTGIIRLTKGMNHLVIWPLNDSFVDVVWLYSITDDQQLFPDSFNSHASKFSINYSKIDPTKYILSVDSDKPFVLAFAESYDPSWVAYTDKDEYNSLPIYSAINSFEINETGHLDITVEYKPQRWFYYGTMISLFTSIICILRIINRPILIK